MTQPSTAPPAPPPAPAPSPDGTPAGPSGTRPGGDSTGGPPGTARRARTARLRQAARAEPGRLRAIGALLAALLVLFGAVTAWQVSGRQAAADAVIEHSQPLSADAARIHRALADADTAASSGFLAGGDEPREVRARYDKEIRRASQLLADAAANSAGSRTAERQIAVLNRGLPVYTGLVEAARADNRQGLPLGGAYLRYANEKMRGELLPAARKLYTAETTRLDNDYADARAWPLLAIGTGAVALAALGWAQVRTFRRTNRVFNPGLLGAGAATLVLLVWLVAGHGTARHGLGESDTKGARSLQALNEAWTASLRARGDENMTLVARGGGAAYEDSYRKQMAGILGGQRLGEPGEGLLPDARALADDAAGRDAVKEAERAVEEWQRRHVAARAKDDSGEYDAAVRQVIGAKGSTGESFDRVDRSLSRAAAHEQDQFDRAARQGRGRLTGLPAGAWALAVLGAAAAVVGIGRRLAEYR
ncbi:hypothetical protein ABZ569_05635 [Streptomyces albus]|uniref:hypothetical protein n=2 Tax=Streptomyces albus TaxID=1888 RepID=UPI0033EC3986